MQKVEESLSNRPAVTIIVPVYNSEMYLSRCLESLVVQELKDIEIVLVDDGSTDKSGKICDFYAQNDHRIQVIHDTNHGPSHARNRGLEIARGDYICFVDSDDTIDSLMLEEMYKIANEPDEGADVVVCNFMSNSIGDFRIVDCGLKEEYVGNENIKNEILKRYFDKTETGLASVCNKIYRKCILKRCNIRFDEELGRAEDYFFNFSVFKNAICVRSTKEAYYKYYQDNQNSIMHTFKENWYEHWKKKHLRLLDLNKDLNFRIDAIKFWRPFSYNTHLYIMRMKKVKGKTAKKKIRLIMQDEVFGKACQIYGKEYALWVRFMDKLISNRAFNIAYFVYDAMIVLRKMFGKII